MGKEISTDCRDEIGITVGLIDSMITLARILRTRDLSSVEVQEALKDLMADEDIHHLFADLDSSHLIY